MKARRGTLRGIEAMSNARKYMIAGGVALIAVLCGRWAPTDGLREDCMRGGSCTEPLSYVIPKVIGQLSTPIAAVCFIWVVVVWWRGRR